MFVCLFVLYLPYLLPKALLDGGLWYWRHTFIKKNVCLPQVQVKRFHCNEQITLLSTINPKMEYSIKII